MSYTFWNPKERTELHNELDRYERNEISIYRATKNLQVKIPNRSYESIRGAINRLRRARFEEQEQRDGL